MLVGEQYICQNIEESSKKCVDFNMDLKQCLKCSTGHHLQEGMCVTDGKFFNTLTMSEQSVPTNCMTIDHLQGDCVKCYNGYYLLKGNCY